MSSTITIDKMKHSQARRYRHVAKKVSSLITYFCFVGFINKRLIITAAQDNGIQNPIDDVARACWILETLN